MNQQLKRIIREAVLDLASQSQLGHALGVDQATVSRWINDKQAMEVSAALKLAKFTGRSPAEILHLAGYNPDEYLPSTLPPIPAGSDAISDRARLLEWERRRREMPPPLQAVLDETIDCILASFAKSPLAEAS